MGEVTHLRNTVLPQELYDLVFAYMCGDIKALHIIAEGKKGITQHSFGKVPEQVRMFSANKIA